MNWKKFIDLVRDKPFLLDDAYILSDSQAKDIYIKDFPDNKEFIHILQDRLPSSLSEEKAAEVNSSLSKIRKRMVLAQSLNGLRFAAAAVIVAMLMLFFTLTPQGRALANRLLHLIISDSKERITVTNGRSTNQRVYGATMDPRMNEIIGALNTSDPDQDSKTEFEFTDFANFQQQTQHIPVVLDLPDAKCTSIQYTIDDDMGQTVISRYIINGNQHVNLLQTWQSDEEISSISQNSEYSNREVLDNQTLFYTIDGKDHTFFGISLLEGSLLRIGADKDVDYNKVCDDLTWYRK